MAYKPVQVFGFIMSFTYVIIGLLFILTNILEQLIAEHMYRILFGAALLIYGAFRIRFFYNKLREKA